MSTITTPTTPKSWDITEQEALLIFEEAIRLIKKPAHWTKGSWKCAISKMDKRGFVIRDEEGEPIQARDRRGRPLWEYCLEGAINQAIVNILGTERAEKLGAYRLVLPKSSGEYTIDFGEPSHFLSLNTTIAELFPKMTTQLLRVDSPWEADDLEDLANRWNDHSDTEHQDVMKVLYTKTRRLRASLKKQALA